MGLNRAVCIKFNSKHGLGHGYQYLCFSLKFKGFEQDNRLSCVKLDYSQTHVNAHKGKTGTLPDKCSLKSPRQNSLDILFLMDAQCNSLFDVEIISVIPGSWQGDGSRTSITVDFGDGHAITYSNVSSIEDGIKHIYKTVGIYRVTATAENSLGFETAVLFLHVTCEWCLHARIFTKFLTNCLYMSSNWHSVDIISIYIHITCHLIQSYRMCIHGAGYSDPNVTIEWEAYEFSQCFLLFFLNHAVFFN